jgi:hypothetical protein
MSPSVQTVPDAQAKETYQRFADLVSSLPSSDGLSHLRLHLHGQGWCASQVPMVAAMVAGARFAARPTDVVLASLPKTGTTWTKVLLLVRSLYRYGPKAVTGLLPRPGRGRPTDPWLVGPRRTVL